ncbi:MAG TPA: hypothetical protein VE251_08110, partial [Xanthobacteraceae bacterium]|nr:hypothetical protein [Xanthobacteraceae bacterium]
PDLVIPANYYNEYVLLARTMQQQRVRQKGIYSVLGGAASSYKFVNGQNQGAAPVNTQVLGNDIQLIFPQTFATAKPVFPMPPA